MGCATVDDPLLLLQCQDGKSGDGRSSSSVSVSGKALPGLSPEALQAMAKSFGLAKPSPSAVPPLPLPPQLEHQAPHLDSPAPAHTGPLLPVRAPLTLPALTVTAPAPSSSSSTTSSGRGLAAAAGAVTGTGTTTPSVSNSEECEYLRYRYEQCMTDAAEAPPMGFGLGMTNIPCVHQYEEVMTKCGSSVSVRDTWPMS